MCHWISINRELFFVLLLVFLSIVLAGSILFKTTNHTQKNVICGLIFLMLIAFLVVLLWWHWILVNIKLFLGIVCLVAVISFIAKALLTNPNYSQKGLFWLLIPIIVTAVVGPIISFCYDRQKSIENRANILKKLDKNSLVFLIGTHGLFLNPNTSDLNTMRYLLELGLVKMEIFPFKKDGPDFTYVLTDDGRKVLEEDLDLKGKIYPAILADLLLVRYWHGYQTSWGKYKNPFEGKKKEFWEKHGVDFDKCLDAFVNKVPQDNLKELKNEGKLENIDTSSYETKLSILNAYLGKFAFDDVMKNTVEPWGKEIRNK